MIDDNGIDLHKREHKESQTQGATEHDTELLNRFASYLKEHCDVHIENMVGRFLEGE